MKLCGFDVGLDAPLFLIAGPCVIESEELALETAGYLKALCEQLGISFIYKYLRLKHCYHQNRSYKNTSNKVKV